MAHGNRSSCHKRRGVQTLDAAEVNEVTFADIQARCLPVLLQGAMLSLLSSYLWLSKNALAYNSALAEDCITHVKSFAQVLSLLGLQCDCGREMLDSHAWTSLRALRACR